MKYTISKLLIFILLIPLATNACKMEEWDKHYYDEEERVNMHVWDAVKEEPRFSRFVELMELTQLDSLFESGLTFTLFIPDNDAMELLSDTTSLIDRILSNHISRTVFQTRNVELSRKLETLLGKFAIISRTHDGFNFQDLTIEYSSPLYLDGKIYEIAGIAHPQPNLYEFTSLYSSVIKSYIDNTDSAYLDKSLSKPIGFDDLGNTIYDSVISIDNRFERDYFPVSQEFRDKTATFVLFTQEQYEDALNVMAENLGGTYHSHEDIPDAWQFDVLLPGIMENSLYDNSLEYYQMTDTMVSVTGDSVFIDPSNINPDSRFICSNGLAYSYHEFHVDSALYLGEIRIEGEDLIDSIGSGIFAWKEDVKASGLVVSPEKKYANEASGKAMVDVTFGTDYSGEYSLEFNFTNVFPMKYRFEWHANYRPSGIYSVYVNDQLVQLQDKYGDSRDVFDTYFLQSSIISVSGDRFIPDNGYNSTDAWVEEITEFGSVKIRFEYIDSGEGKINGFNIDYVALIPALEE